MAESIEKMNEKSNIEPDNLTESAIQMNSVTNNSHIGSFENILEQMKEEKPKENSDNSFKKKRQTPKNQNNEEKEEDNEEEESEENEQEIIEEEEEEEEQESSSRININKEIEKNEKERQKQIQKNSAFCFKLNNAENGFFYPFSRWTDIVSFQCLEFSASCHTHNYSH